MVRGRALGAVLSVVMLGCGGGATPTGGGSAASAVPATTPTVTAAPTPTSAPGGMTADQIAHIVAAIDDLALLTDITGEDLGADFVAWFDTEANWITAEMDAGMILDPAIAEYISAVASARQKVIDGIYVLPSGAYEFNAELDAIVRLRDRIAAIADQP